MVRSPELNFSRNFAFFLQETFILRTMRAKLPLRKQKTLSSEGVSSEESKGEITMKSNTQINVPQAKAAMEQFKMQAAQEVGVNLTNGYNVT